jgi:hypothetical protein
VPFDGNQYSYTTQLIEKDFLTIVRVMKGFFLTSIVFLDIADYILRPALNRKQEDG